MRCPTCGTEMTPGRFGTHEEGWHKQAFGPFGLPLVFDPAGEGPTVKVWAGTREGARGHVCPRCRTVILEEAPEHAGLDTWECPACGEIVPGKFDVCCRCQYHRETTG